MTRALSVKVPVSSVIEALNKKIEENEKTVEANKVAEATYALEMENWVKTIATQVPLEITSGSVRSWNNTVEITYKYSEKTEFPKQPEREVKPVLHHSEIEEIKNAIRILEMTSDEFVNASTMKSIGRYL